MPLTGSGVVAVIVQGSGQDLSPGRFRARYATRAITTAPRPAATPIVAHRWFDQRPFAKSRMFFQRSWIAGHGRKAANARLNRHRSVPAWRAGRDAAGHRTAPPDRRARARV